MLVNYSQEWAVLLCKMGTHFMKIDGNIAASESKFVRLFIEELGNSSEHKINVDEILAQTMSLSFTLDDILADTDKLLNEIEDNARTTVILLLTSFISSIILADGIITAEENSSFFQWKTHFNLMF